MGKIADTKDLMDVVGKFSRFIVGDKSDSLRIDCMNGIGYYFSTVDVETRFSKWVKKRGKITYEFNQDEVYSVRVFSVKPTPRRIDEAVGIQDGKFTLDLNKVLKEDVFRLEVGYRMDESWLEGMVRARSSPEPLQDAQKWHLSAQLIDPTSLIGGFSEVEIEEYPVSARVHIKEQINTNIPSYVVKMAEIEAEILSDYDPHHAIKVIGLQKKKARLKRRLSEQDLMTQLNELSIFLRPNKFLNYVSMPSEQDFRLHCCEWGSEVFRALGMMPLPSKMNVTSRADLNLDKPAASGSMIYQTKKFETDVQNVFIKNKP